MKNIAIVTGAGGGFGKELTRLLSKETELDEIWAIARSTDRLEALRQELGEIIRPVPMDLTERDSFSSLESMLKAGDVRVAYLINNAGYAKFCSCEELSTEETLNMIDLNVSAVVALGLICLPFMDKGCRIMNISSLSSFFPLPYLNTYASTKVFVRNYTRALNVELRKRGITATAVCPGWMSTDLYARAKTGSRSETNNFFGIKPPEKVAQKALKDTKKGKDMSTYGIYVKSIHLLSRLLPKRLLMRIWLSQQKIK